MTVVITGGSGAIGSMCAYEAARLGYNILLSYTSNKSGADAVVDMLSGFDVKIETVCADITKDYKKIADKHHYGLTKERIIMYNRKVLLYSESIRNKTGGL